MSLVFRPSAQTARVQAGGRILASHQNRTQAALRQIQAAQNRLISVNAKPWAEQMLHVVRAIQGDYLECVRLWRGVTEGTEVVYIARPPRLRTSETSRDGVTYAYTNTQTRTASKSGEDDETQVVTPTYLIGDYIEAVFVRGLSRVPEVDAQRRALVDANVDGRQWAVQA